mmetsp:Transcript_14735/g.41489  ORF Transcript_14735/g.41489 Transcript_14735/m.41489 type:complete len:206 (-) Transcript_14735:1099-1716(-)
MSSGSRVVMPVGHLLVLHLRAWMHPRANIMARAEFITSAPRDMVRTSENPVRALPEAMMLTFSRIPAAVRMSWTKARPSLRGVPTRLLNSGGAAPVPPSPPSTVMKSGWTPSCSIACTRAANSSRRPTHSLKPTGFPPDSFLSLVMKLQRPRGPSNAEWVAGELHVCPTSMPLASAISAVTLAPGNIPPCAGFAPWESLISIIFT